VLVLGAGVEGGMDGGWLGERDGEREEEEEDDKLKTVFDASLGAAARGRGRGFAKVCLGGHT
jgi:hypothetical protein